MERKPKETFDSVKTLAQRWLVSERTIRRLIAAGELPVHWIGSQARISPEDRKVYERRHRT